MTSESQPRVMSILEVFPMELLAEIRSHIPQKDLRTNVCFHNTCPLFASLFGPAEDQRVFWEGACLLVGLGCLPGETPHEVDWKRVALEYIEKDGFCGHPECSSNRLQNNATYMAEMSNPSCWDKFEVYGELEDTPEDSQVHVNPLLSHIGFETDASEWDPLPEEEDAYLRYGGNSETPSGQNRYLWDHPIACRSFAMFPPLQRMPRWNHFRGFYGIVNVSGITVWDIQAAFWETLDPPLQVQEVARLLGTMRDYDFVFEDNADSIQDVFYSMSTMRGFLEYFTWNGIDWTGGGHPHFDPYVR